MRHLAFLADHQILIPITAGYLSGIYLTLWYAQRGWVWWISIAVFSAACLLSHLCGHRLSAIILLVLTFVIFGFAHADRRALPSLDQDHIVRHVTAPQQVVIVGTLAKTVTKGGSSCRAQIDVSFIRTDIDGPLKPVEGRTLLSLKGAWPTDIRPGDSLTARAVLDFPAVVNTPGTFNYREYLARRSIYLTGFVTHPALIRHTEKIDRPLSRRVLYRIERLRADIGSFLDSRLPA
ncbi:MAG: DUF4131 domain-containing protein, partial [Desulfofustis sp.]|nr:DUF4131 domain-containing protein [Desulfofustis sp.]